MSYALRAVGWAQGGLASLADYLSLSETRRLDAIETRITKLMAQATITTVSGIVESVNDNGFKLLGGDWLNYSKYDYQGPKGGQLAPAAGQHVTAQLKNDKFLLALNIDGATQPTATRSPSTPPPATNGTVLAQPALPSISQPAPINQNTLIETTIQTRLKLIGTLAVAQPGLFSLEDMDTVTEIVRNLEQFVLEDLIAATKPESDDELTADDLDEEV